VLAAPVWSVASIFAFSIFARRVSLFEHLFPASGRATRMPCNENAVRMYRLRAPNRGERISLMQKEVDQRTQGDSLKLGTTRTFSISEGFSGAFSLL